MVIAQEGLQSNGSSGPPPQRAISPHAQPKSAPKASGDAQQGVSRRPRQECHAPMNVLDQTTGQSGEATHPRASAPTSRPSGFPYSKFVVFASSATLPLLTQRLLCCIDGLNLQPKAGGRKQTEIRPKRPPGYLRGNKRRSPARWVAIFA